MNDPSHQKLLGGRTLQRTSQRFAGMQVEMCAGRRCKTAGSAGHGSKSRDRGQEAWLEKRRSEPDGVHECISGENHFFKLKTFFEWRFFKLNFYV